MHEWTFITRHAVVLSLIAQNPQITAIELGMLVGLTERAVRKIIADLFAAGYIGKKKKGRGLKYDINPSVPLRQDIHHGVSIGDLLKSLGWKRVSPEM